MKKFIITSAILLALALLMVVAVFTWLLLQAPSVPAVVSDIEEAGSALLDTVTESATETERVTVDQVTAVPVVPAEGIPLRTLPLSDSQRSTIESFGIEVETFVITPSMVSCVESRVGSDRFAEIIAGAEPSFLEITRMATCLVVS